ncbi:YgjV family protein [Sporomusa termitida]|uniref:Bacterial inner membrane protein n=1 Tax=Sporomusa termitida TaxID=2377 RepID=A0A517DYM1_9FIRM|nr:YgjV family protein [Sporomusa termitida]QDR82467.1 hypothetical protein SPTER_38950 [Sporomusa termitida]
METINLVEWLGYLASALVAVSFVMKSINKLRFINLVGAVLFVVYGIAIQAMPVVLANLFIVCVNVYYLFKKNAG